MKERFSVIPTYGLLKELKLFSLGIKLGWTVNWCGFFFYDKPRLDSKLYDDYLSFESVAFLSLECVVCLSFFVSILSTLKNYGSLYLAYAFVVVKYDGLGIIAL